MINGGRYRSIEASNIDEKIYYFVEEREMVLSDSIIKFGFDANTMIRFQFFPRSQGIVKPIQDIIFLF